MSAMNAHECQEYRLGHSSMAFVALLAFAQQSRKPEDTIYHYLFVYVRASAVL